MIKLPKLPDRTPIKISISVNAALHQELLAYADIYAMTYAEIVTIQDIIPFMLSSFLESDRAFTRTQRTTPTLSLRKKGRPQRSHIKTRAESSDRIATA